MKYFLRNVVQIICNIIMVFVLSTVLFTKLDRDRSNIDFTGRIFMEDYVSNIFIFLIVIFVIFIVRKIKYKKSYLFKDNMKLSLVVASFILLVLQFFLTYHTYYIAGYDVLNIRAGAECFVNGNYDQFLNCEYYQMCPNNLMAYMIYIIAYTIGDIIGVNGNIILIVCTVFMVNTAVLCSALVVFKLTNSQRTTWFTYVISALLFGLLPWIGIPYTDMLSILSPILSFYIYIELREKNISEYLKWFLICLIPIVMFGLKPLNIIILIAIILCEILYFSWSKDNWKKVFQIILSLIAVVILYSSLQGGIKEYVGFVEDKEKSLGLTWVLLLGSNDKTYGQWSYEDYALAQSYDTQAERQEKMLQKVGERLSNMGFEGYLSHLMNKTHMFYNDSHFGWSTIQGYVIEMPERDGIVSNIMRNIFYPPENYWFTPNCPGYGDFFKEYSIIRQFVWISVLMFMTIGICIPSNDKRILILKMTWIGVFLFTMLFETHARMLISYLPIFVVIAGVGAKRLEKS